MALVKYLAVILVAITVATGASAKPYLYVQNANSGDISIISIPDHELVSVVKVGGHPDDVVGSSDGKMVFVSVGHDSGHIMGFPESGEVVAVSTADDRILWRTAIENGWPHHLSASPKGRVYVPVFDRAYLLDLDAATGKVMGRIDGGYGMHTTRLSADGERLYAGSILTSSLYVFDTNAKGPKNIINFRDGVRPFTFTRDEKTLYSQLSRLHGFVVVDLEKNEVTKTVTLPGLPADFKYPENFPHNVNHGLELSPDEQYLFAAGTVTNSVSVYTHPGLELIKTIPVGSDPNWIAFSPDGQFAYVGCRGSNEVSVISVRELREVKRVKTGGMGSARVRIVDVPARSMPARQ